MVGFGVPPSETKYNQGREVESHYSAYFPYHGESSVCDGCLYDVEGTSLHLDGLFA